MSKAWPRVRLGEVLRLDLEKVPVDPSVIYPMVGVLSFGRGLFDREPIENGNTSYKYFHRLKEEHVVMSQLFGWEGALALSSDKFSGKFLSLQFPTFLCNSEKLDRQFLGWLMHRKDFWDDLGSRTTGMGDRRRTLNPASLFACEIPLPPLTEQKKIVARIEELASQIQEARTLRQQAIEEAEALLLAQLNVTFRRHIEQYGANPLEKLIREASYGSSEKCNSERTEGSIPVLRIPNVVLEKITLDNLKYARLEKSDKQRLLLNEGDILVVRTNGSLDLVGRSAVVAQLNEPTAFASYMIRLRLDGTAMINEYVQRMLRHLRFAGLLVGLARTNAGQYNVSLGRLRSAKIPTPPISEQRRIVAELDSLQTEVDKLKCLQTEAAAELDALLPAILDRAFKGEL